jgi:N-acetylglucosaminyl-diphospho-decaprenol L-rhamnosyltransferase
VNPAEIGVVIVTHDTCSEVLDALRSLTDYRGPVVVVDAGSTDGTVDTVRAEHPDVTVLELANVGYGRGVNAGVDRLGPDVEVVVAANADVLLSPEAVARLGEEIMADDRIAMVGPRVRYPDGSHQASARRTPDLATALTHAALGWLRPDNAATRRYHALDLTGPDVDEACDVDWVSGCAFAVRRTDFAAVGGFDPGYRLFVEDVDLCERLRAEGRSIRFEPRVVVTHRVGASTSRNPLRSRLLHARALDRYLSRPRRGPVRHLRPVLWPGMAAWALATATAARLRAGSRSMTGEQRR